MTTDVPPLRACLDRLVQRLGVPAAGAGLFAIGQAPILAVAGRRRRDNPDPVQAGDRWRSSSCCMASEPHVPHAAAVLRQVVECIEPVEMVDRKVRHLLGRGKADIDRHAPAPVFSGPHRPPGDNTCTAGAEVEFKERVCPFLAGIDCGGTEYPNAFPLPVIGPERPIAAADRAVAGSDRARVVIELPFDRAAVAGALRLVFSFPWNETSPPDKTIKRQQGSPHTSRIVEKTDGVTAMSRNHLSSGPVKTLRIACIKAA